MSTDLREAFHRAANAVPPMGNAERAVRSSRRRRRAATVAAPLAVLALVGGVWSVSAGSLSGDEPPFTDSSPSPIPATLAGRTWVLESIAKGNVYIALPEGTQSTVGFDDGAMEVDFGCNGGGGEVTVTSSTIQIESMGATEIRCGPAEMSLEESVARALSVEKLSYVVEGDRLTLRGENGRLVYHATS